MKNKSPLAPAIAAIVVGLVSLLPLSAPAETLRVSRQSTGAGWLERSDQNQLILHLAGSWRDMGRQQGELMRDEVAATMRTLQATMTGFLPRVPPDTLYRLSYGLVHLPSRPFIPAEVREEMAGLAETSGQDLRDLFTLHSLIFINSCSGTGVFGRASRDGNLYQTRSLDYGLDMIDPRTGKSLQENSLITVYNPDRGIPFVTFGWPGLVGSLGGQNALGISVSEMTDASWAEKPGGLDMIWRIKQTLYRAHNFDEAVTLMTAPPFDGGYNFLVGGGREKTAAAVEMNGYGVYSGGWDGPAESSSYTHRGKTWTYTPLPDVLIRTNHPLSKKMIGVYNGIIDKGGLARASGPRYFDLRARAAAGYGNWDLESLFLAQRDHYQSHEKDNGHCQATIYQAAFAPLSGDFFIGFAAGNEEKDGTCKVSAYNQPYGRYNLFKLLSAKP